MKEQSLYQKNFYRPQGRFQDIILWLFGMTINRDNFRSLLPFSRDRLRICCGQASGTNFRHFTVYKQSAFPLL